MGVNIFLVDAKRKLIFWFTCKERKLMLLFFFEKERQLLFFMYHLRGCHGQRKVREKRKFFKVREKSGNFLKSQEKSYIVKVSEKSGNSVFLFIVHDFCSRLWDAFSFEKDKKYATKQAKWSIWHSMPDIVVVVSGFHCECFLSNSFSLLLRKVERDWNEEKNIDDLQKS